MCGIVGYLDKSGGEGHPLGKTLLAMLQALGCRGPDSAGVALFGGRSGWHLRFQAPPDMNADTVVTTVNSSATSIDIAIQRHDGKGVFDALVSPAAEAWLPEVEDRLLSVLPGTEVICLGRHLNLAKQVGSPERLDRSYAVSTWTGTHGIGHTRLSTESRVDLSHSQPFWAHGVPDLATVHNGHITNYHKLRRRFEAKGHRFYTENDSEIIGVYLRDRMTAGLSLEDALRSSLDDFDGSFSYLAAWGDGLAYVRDRFGFKPLIVAETDDFVAIATEEIALRRALGDGFVAREPSPGSMKVWSVPTRPTTHEEDA